MLPVYIFEQEINICDLGAERSNFTCGLNFDEEIGEILMKITSEAKARKGTYIVTTSWRLPLQDDFL